MYIYRIRVARDKASSFSGQNKKASSNTEETGSQDIPHWNTVPHVYFKKQGSLAECVQGRTASSKGPTQTEAKPSRKNAACWKGGFLSYLIQK